MIRRNKENVYTVKDCGYYIEPLLGSMFYE